MKSLVYFLNLIGSFSKTIGFENGQEKDWLIQRRVCKVKTDTKQKSSKNVYCLKNLIMKTYLKLLFFTFVVVSGLNACSSDTSADIPIEKQLSDLFQKSNLETNVIVISSLKDNKIEYTLHDGWEFAWNNTQNKPGDTVCEGSGLSFGKCVKDFVDSGKCCIVYKVGDKYYAQETVCPISTEL